MKLSLVWRIFAWLMLGAALGFMVTDLLFSTATPFTPFFTLVSALGFGIAGLHRRMDLLERDVIERPNSLPGSKDQV